MEPKFKTIGQIKKEHFLFTYEDKTALEVATELLESHFPGMPVINQKNEVVGYVSEQDILRALRGPISLDKTKIKVIMSMSPIVADENTTLENASKLMEDIRIHCLPLVRDGKLIGTVTRHDLLRAWLGVSPSIEDKTFVIP